MDKKNTTQQYGTETASRYYKEKTSIIYKRAAGGGEKNNKGTHTQNSENQTGKRRHTSSSVFFSKAEP